MYMKFKSTVGSGNCEYPRMIGDGEVPIY